MSHSLRPIRSRRRDLLCLKQSSTSSLVYAVEEIGPRVSLLHILLLRLRHRHPTRRTSPSRQAQTRDCPFRHIPFRRTLSIPGRQRSLCLGTEYPCVRHRSVLQQIRTLVSMKEWFRARRGDRQTRYLSQSSLHVSKAFDETPFRRRTSGD